MTDPDQLSRKKVFAVLMLVLIFGLAMSAVFLLRDRPNYQEVYDLHVASQHIAVQTLGSNDDPMPLYFLLLHGWVHLVAVDLKFFSLRIAGRVFSIICYGLSIIVAYLIGASTTGKRKSGLYGAVLLGLSPFLLWYGNRASMYSLLVLAVLINQYFFAKLLDKPRWWAWPLYLFSGLAALSIHYFFAIILLVQLIFYAVKRPTSLRRQVEPLLMTLCMIAFVVFFSLWAHYSTVHTNFWNYLPFTARPSATNTFIIFVQYLFGFQSVVTTTLLIAFWPLLVILALLGIQKYVSPTVGIQYSAWAATIPILIMFGLGWIWRPLFLSSYLIVGLPSLMLFLGWYFSAFKLRTLGAAYFVLIALMLATLFTEVLNPRRAIQGDYLGAAYPSHVSTVGQRTIERR